MANQFNVLLARDVINGQQGRATANINGSVQDMFYVRNIEVTFTKIRQKLRRWTIQVLNIRLLVGQVQER